MTTLTVLPQDPPQFSLPPQAVRHLELIPRALHVVQVLLRIALVPHGHDHPPPCLLHTPCVEQCPGGEVVDV